MLLIRPERSDLFSGSDYKHLVTYHPRQIRILSTYPATPFLYFFYTLTPDFYDIFAAKNLFSRHIQNIPVEVDCEYRRDNWHRAGIAPVGLSDLCPD